MQMMIKIRESTWMLYLVPLGDGNKTIMQNTNGKNYALVVEFS